MNSNDIQGFISKDRTRNERRVKAAAHKAAKRKRAQEQRIWRRNTSVGAVLKDENDNCIVEDRMVQIDKRIREIALEQRLLNGAFLHPRIETAHKLDVKAQIEEIHNPEPQTEEDHIPCSGLLAFSAAIGLLGWTFQYKVA